MFNKHLLHSYHCLCLKPGPLWVCHDRCTIIPLLLPGGLPLSLPHQPCVNHLQPDRELPLGSEGRNGQVRELGQSLSALAAY